MSFSIAIIREITPDENRVALVPESVKKLTDKGFNVYLEKGAGENARYPDSSYRESGAEVLENAREVLSRSKIILKVQPPTPEEIDVITPNSFLIGFLQHYKYPERIKKMAERKINAFAMELIPRISRAQSIDALSSQAAVAGYKAAIIAANMSSRFFPMLTTAAGTIRPSKVLVIGAGVAGLQAIATSRRLGAIVEAYDVRKAVKEEIQSLGTKFLESPLVAEGTGGYQRELTKPGETVEHKGVLIYGPLNLPSTLPTHASEMYSKNLLNFLNLLTKDGKTLDVDFNDEVLQKSCLTYKGETKI